MINNSSSNNSHNNSLLMFCKSAGLLQREKREGVTSESWKASVGQVTDWQIQCLTVNPYISLMQATEGSSSKPAIAKKQQEQWPTLPRLTSKKWPQCMKCPGTAAAVTIFLQVNQTQRVKHTLLSMSSSSSSIPLHFPTHFHRYC